MRSTVTPSVAAFGGPIRAAVERVPPRLRRPLAILGIAVGAGTFLAVLAFAVVAATLPSADEFVRENLPLPTKVYARDGTTLLYEFAEERREPVKYDELPKQVVAATISAEDRTFWTNPGIDVGGILRAALRDLVSRDDRPQGASTITQQLVKQRLVGNELSLWRKMREAVMAIKITSRYSKEEILELYLNQIYYGDQAYGIKAAARAYFGTDDLSRLTLGQTALLAGLPQSPSRLDPTQPENLERAKARRSYVLEQMLEDGATSSADKDRAEAEPITVNPGVLPDIRAPHFVFAVREQLAQILGSDADIARGGYTVVTTLDWSKQQEAEKQVADWVEQLHAKNVWNAALVSIDPKTGEVLAYVGSVSYFDADPKVQGQFDVAGLGYRQPGSAFKVFNYLTALKNGATPATVVVDARTSFGGYMPQNADGQYHGPITMRQAIRESRNVPAVKFLQLYSGIDPTIATARAMGIQADFEGANAGLTLTLGAVPVRLIDMTSAYSVLANMGERVSPELILEAKDRDGRVIHHSDPHPARVLSPEISWLMTDMLKDTTTISPVFASWTGIGRPAALKTGTTDDLKDVYAVGYTPQVVTGVWMGNSDGTPMSSHDFFSAMGPGQLWRDYMKAILENEPAADWPRPAGIVTARVVSAPGALGGYGSGLVPSSLSPFSTTEYFVNGTAPQKLDDWSQAGCATSTAAGSPAPSATPAGGGQSNTMVVKETGPDAWRPYTQAWVKDAIVGRYDYGRFPWSKLLTTGEPCPSPSPSASPSPSPSATQSPHGTLSPRPSPTPSATPPPPTPTPTPTPRKT
jgi:membrane peptidoglycan carboxypeptidase